MLIWQAAMEGESIGTMKGLTRLPPWSRKTRSPATTSPIPPPPVFTITAMSSRLASVISRPASAMAWAADATAIWLNRLMRRACLKSIQVAGSKPLISAAICTSSEDGSYEAMRATPLTPPVRLVQKVSTSFPMGVIAPIPVTTARRRSSRPMPARSVPPATEDDRAVVTSEPHRVRDGDSDVGGARLVGDVVERQVRIRMAEVDGRWDAAGLEDLGAYESFEGARGSHH